MHTKHRAKRLLKPKKTSFKLFDFFANCEYFEDKFNYDEVLRLPPKTGTGGGEGGGINIDEIKVFNPDPLKTMTETAVGLQGMRVDRELFQKFESEIKSNEQIKELYRAGDLEAVEDYIRNEVFDKPEEFYNLDKLRKSISADRRISLKEMVHKIFGGINRFKSKDELLEDEFEKFVSIYKPENRYVVPIKNYLKAYITDDEIRDVIESKEYGRLATNPKLTLSELKDVNGYIEVVPEYVKDYVSLNAFM